MATTDFFVRVELHGATEQQYQLLHQRMRAAGYFMSIQAPAEPKTLRLPTAMYHAILDDTVGAEQVRDHVSQIAVGVRPTPHPWVLAVRASDWAIISQVNPPA